MFIINGVEWLVKFVQPFDSIFIMDNGSYTVGVCDSETHTIYLANSLKGSFLKKVLCHEIVHAAMFSYDIKLEYNQEELLANLIATYGKEIINIADDVFRRLR